MMRRVLPARSTTASRSSASSSRCGSRTKTLVLFVGAVTVGTVIGMGEAFADPGARSDHSNSRSGSNGRDTTGWHHIDPFGYHHTPQNSLRRNEHQNNLREYRSQNAAEPEATGNRPAGATTWTRVPRADGDGWTVCRARAKTC